MEIAPALSDEEICGFSPIYEERVVWKVVRKKRGSKWLSSAIACSLDHEFQVHYKPGSRVSPNVGGTFLFAFDTLESASTWQEALNTGSRDEFEVWESRAEVLLDPDGLVVTPTRSTLVNHLNMKIFWSGEPFSSGCYAPAGSLWCTWLQLRERVL